MNQDRQNLANEMILAIECAVGFGSVAVLRDGRSIASTSDQVSRPSRAEEVLGTIERLLTSADVAVGEIRRIVVSAGPGSYSGIRIGLATALGLKHSLGIACTPIPLLEGMAASSCVNTTLAVAIPVGRKDIAWQLFGKDNLAVSDPELAPESEFLDWLGVTLPSTLFSPLDPVRLGDRLSESIRFVHSGHLLAEYLGTYALRNPDAELSRPLYLRNRNYTGQIPERPA